MTEMLWKVYDSAIWKRARVLVVIGSNLSRRNRGLIVHFLLEQLVDQHGALDLFAQLLT